MKEFQKIKYHLDGELVHRLFREIENKDQEITALKFIIQNLENTKLPQYSISKEPDFINLEHLSVNLKMAVLLKIDSSSYPLHVIGTIYANGLHEHHEYAYYISDEIINKTDILTKEICLIQMHDQLIKEIIKNNKKRTKDSSL